LSIKSFIKSRPVPVLPNLQKLASNWSGDTHTSSEQSLSLITPEIELHPVDNSPCDTYFYCPVAAHSSNGRGMMQQYNIVKDFQHLMVSIN
jgi:hypothetical protein